MNKNIAIIMVNYNAGKLLAGNLRQIADSAPAGCTVQVFIVDNQSPDDSFNILQHAIADQKLNNVSLIAADRNGGFAYGNNVGIKAALESGFQPDYFYLLNPDAYPLPGALDELLKVSVEYKDNCLLGSTLHDEKLIPRCSAFRFPSVISELQRGMRLGILDRIFKHKVVALPLQEKPFNCDWVSGAGFFFSKTVFDRIGYMDENYFLYYEEVDYMSHALNNGVAILSIPDSKIVHIAGVSTQIVGGKTNKKPMPVYWYDSWHRYFFKNHSTIYAMLAAIAWITGRTIDNLLSVFIKKRRHYDGHSVSRFFKYALVGQKHD